MRERRFVGAGIPVEFTEVGKSAVRRRNRHGRGQRGPDVVPSVPGQPSTRTRRERFDDLVLDLAEEIEDMLHRELPLLEYAVEDAPVIPRDWAGETVPLSSLIRGKGTQPTRLVIFRKPVEQRCKDRVELEAMVSTIVVEQIAELLGLRPDEIDPRYES